MNYQLPLERPISTARGRVAAWWGDLRRTCGLAAAAVGEERDAIIAIQWLVAIGTSYLVFALHNGSVSEPLPVLIILVSLVSAPVVQRIPAGVLRRGLFQRGLLVLNSILIVSAMTLSEQTPQDLLLLFFFCVFIAAIGENLIQIGVGCALLSLIFLMFVSPNTVDVLAIDPDLLIRVPFMFGISIFYGYMTNQVKREKKRVEMMQETMRLKRQFVSALAHDIKTPLNVILGHAELLAGSYGAQDPTERLSSFKRIRDNIDRIGQLITDFLAVSKLETLKLESAKKPVQINALAADVVLQQMVTARDKQINLTVKLDNDLRPVLGDDDQLRRVLWNLVGNAIKFTPRGGSITVASRMDKKDVSIAVTDNGPGIPEEELPSLFSEFRRLNRTANTEGTGLGLFIVKTIVESHGGTVTVQSKNGGGTSFTILLPASEESGAMRPNRAANESETETWVGRCA